MAIVTKKIGGREYVYHSMRDGRKIITQYIGPAGSPEALSAVDEHEAANTVPVRFRTLFWDTHRENIDLRRNARYVIERVLEDGNLEAINWLLRIYTVKKILDVAETSRRISKKSGQFWRLWFGAEAA